MRKIYNNALLKQKVVDFNQSLFSKRTFEMPLVSLGNMLKKRNKQTLYQLDTPTVNAYLLKIIRNYQRIINADGDEMKKLIKEFNLILPHKAMTTEFHEAIVDAMRYKELREKEFLEFIQDMNIKNCIYCHAQLAITVVDGYYLIANRAAGAVAGDVRSRRGLFQLDHRYPKSKFPFLCTSFYNLYPVCANCNIVKSKKDSAFELYAETDDLEVFTFKLTDASVIAYETSKKHQDLVIQIEPVNQTAKSAENYLEMFDIQEIYDTQKDLAEELLHKKTVYNNPYKKRLIDNFKLLFNDQSIIDRMIIGNYDQPEDVLKRPMAKFVQDIARDIELIPPL